MPGGPPSFRLILIWNIFPQVPLTRADSFAAWRSTLQVDFLTMSQLPVSAGPTGSQKPPGDFKRERWP